MRAGLFPTNFSACNCLKVYERTGLAKKRVYASAAWSHHL